MSFVLNATPGDPAANSYPTLVEAQAYWDSRLFTAAWDDSDGQSVALAWATRTLDAMLSGTREYFPSTLVQKAYMHTFPAWTGTRATDAQALAWPRLGMFSRLGVSLNISLLSNSAANPTIVTTAVPHGRVSGDIVRIADVVGSVPDINGAQTVTVLSTTSFSVPVIVTTAGLGGTLTFIPQDLKNAVAELAGAMSKADRTLDNDVVVQGLTSIKAGPVALTFKSDGSIPMLKALPQMVLALLVPSWTTSDVVEPVIRAEFDVIV